MEAARRLVSSLIRNDEGQTLFEYALLIFLVALVAVGALTLLGNNLVPFFTQMANAL